MSEKLIVYQKPTCSTCRTALKLLKETDVEFESVNYYETPLTAEQLREVIGRLGVSPRDILRKKEAIYRELDLDKREVSDEELIQLMVKHPDLIQRPIAVKGDQAVLARPAEKIMDIV